MVSKTKTKTKTELSKIRSIASLQRVTITKKCEASNCDTTIKGLTTIKHCDNKCKQHCKNERIKTAKILKSNPTDLRKLVERCNNNNTTMSNPLLWASELGNLEVVKHLSANGARHPNAIQLANKNTQSDVTAYLNSKGNN